MMATLIQARPARVKTKNASRPELKGIPAIAFVVVLYFVPVSFVLLHSLTVPRFGLQNYLEILRDPGDLRILLTTIVLAAVTAVLSILVGYPLAVVIARSSRLLGGILMTCVMVPFLTNTLIRTFGWQVVLNSDIVTWMNGGNSLLGTWVAVVIGLVHLTLPLVVLALVVGMREMDSRLPLVGHSLGAGPVATFFRVYLPLTLPAIEIAFIIGFVYSVGAFATPIILGGYGPWVSMVGSVIYDLTFTQVDFGSASAFAVLLVGLCLTVILAYKWLLGGRLEWLVRRSAGGAVVRKSAHTGRSSHHRRVRVGFDRGLSRMCALVDTYAGWMPYGALAKTWAALTAVFLLLPEVLAIPTSVTEVRVLTFPPVGFSMQWYEEFFTQWIDPALLSVGLAIAAALIVPPLALLAGAAVERSANRRFRAFSTVVLLTPAVIPPVVAAVGYYLSFLRIGLVDTVIGLLVAVSCLAMPYAYVVLSGSMRGLDPTFEKAAASLGAGRVMVLRRVVAPMVISGLVAAAGMTFLMVLDESSVSIFLSGLSVKTLSARMFEAVLLESDPTVAVVAALSMAMIFVGVCAYLLSTRRKHAKRTR